MTARPCLLVAAWLLASSTSPAADDKKPLSRIAFGSCIHQDRDQGIWKPLVATRPELFLFLGDNVYADTEDMAELRRIYGQLGGQPGYRKLLETCPILATWDDHDYGKDDAGVEYPKKKESQEAFLDFFKVGRDSPLRKQEGVYQASVFGPPGKRVQVILLDMRYHRSPLVKDPRRPRNLGQYVPVTDPKATMLGEAQWKWLGDQLKVPAEIRLLGSSVQLVAEDHGFEKWMNIPAERKKLLQLLRDTRANGVVVLSGDRHLAELSAMDADLGYPLYDVTSSGMNMANKRFRALEPNRHRVAIMDRGNNFGLIRIDWEREDPLVSLEIHDDEGDVTIRHKVPLSRLQPATRRKPKKGEGKDLAEEARKFVGKEWKVAMQVRGTGSNKGRSMVFLNSEKDFRSERNLTIVLELKTLARELEAAKISNPLEHYRGKKIEVTGTVSEYRGSPQIQVKSLKQIKIVE